MAKRDLYHITEKTESNKGKYGCVLSIISVLMLLIVILRSALSPVTNLEVLVGIYAFLLALVSCGLCIDSLRREEDYRILAVIGTILSIFMIGGSIGIFLLGV